MRELIPLHYASGPACNNNTHDYSLKQTQPLLKSSILSHNRLPALVSSKLPSQMCRMLHPLLSTRSANWLPMLTHNLMLSRHLYLMFRPQHMRSCNVWRVISTTYTIEYENRIQYTNADSLELRKGLVSYSGTRACRNVNVL